MYTYRYSTEPSITVTSICPICRERKSHNQAERHTTSSVNPSQLCCCKAHEKAYLEKLYTLEKQAWRARHGQTRLPRGVKARAMLRGSLDGCAMQYLASTL